MGSGQWILITSPTSFGMLKQLGDCTFDPDDTSLLSFDPIKDACCKYTISGKSYTAHVQEELKNSASIRRGMLFDPFVGIGPGDLDLALGHIRDSRLVDPEVRLRDLM